jgi:hypothetical protein
VSYVRNWRCCMPASWSVDSATGPRWAVARKLVTYLLAVDKSGQSFQLRTLLPQARAEQEVAQKIKTA